jgi:hypothetical protein
MRTTHPVETSTAPSGASVLDAFKALAAADPAAAFHLRDDLVDVIREAAYPALVVGTVLDELEDSGTRVALIDPYTGDEVHTITAVDVAERWTESQSVDHGEKAICIPHPDGADCHGLVYLNEDNQPVSLPAGWDLTWV